MTTLKTAAGLLAILLIAPTMSAGDDAALYKAKCAMCHGEKGAGDTTMGKKLGLKDLGSADVQKKTDPELSKLVTDEKGKMPAYGAKLTADQIKGLIGHLRTFAKK